MGDRTEAVARALICVDVTDAVVDAAVAGDVDIIVAHHPLLLRGACDSVAADTAKGSVLHRLIRARTALFTAHTDADSARPGVRMRSRMYSASSTPRRCSPAPLAPMDKWIVMVPEGSAEQVSEATAAGAGAVVGAPRLRMVGGRRRWFEARGAADEKQSGRYGRTDACRRSAGGNGRGARSAPVVLAALGAAHPYEEPAFDVLAEEAIDSDAVLGRVGRLASPSTVGEFVTRAAALRSPWGVRATGERSRVVETVAVCGGAGDSLLERISVASASTCI